MNTKKQGIVRMIIFKSGQIFRAVCLDFDLIVDADTMEEAEKEIRLMTSDYLLNVCKNNLDDALLNRHADKEYWDMWRENSNYAAAKTPKQKIDEPVFTFSFPIKLMAAC